MQDSEGVRIFEEKHMISILLFIYENGPSRKMDIYDNVSKNPRMPDKIEKLEENGLLYTEPDPEGKATVLIHLTPKGITASQTLIGLDRVIRE